MKFLIVDDEEDLRDILCILIAANYDVDTYQAKDGAEAIEAIKQEGPFDIVICDYNMPKKNGFDVYTHLREQFPTTPFLLVSGNTAPFQKQAQSLRYFDSLTKPFNEEQLTEKIKNLLVQKNLPNQKNVHIPVGLDLLRKVENPGASLFIKLNENHFIKVLKDDAIFSDKEYERFKKKKVEHLYVELIDIRQFIANFRRNVFSLIDWKNVDTEVAQKVLAQDWALILEANQNLGWSQSVADLSRENITRTLALLARQPELKKYFEKFMVENNKYKIPLHCYLLVFTTSQILEKLNWKSDNTLRKLTFACLLHDIELNELMFKNKLSLLDVEKMSDQLNQPVNYAIYHHTMKAAEIATNWSSCPPDVDKIILQHHEKFDGTGFPQKLNFLTIFPLAAIFIIAEDMVYLKTKNPSVNLSEYLKQKESYYSRGDMKEIYQASLKVAEDLDN